MMVKEILWMGPSEFTFRLFYSQWNYTKAEDTVVTSAAVVYSVQCAVCTAQAAPIAPCPAELQLSVIAAANCQLSEQPEPYSKFPAAAA